jgi:hypothetical protein
VGAEDVRHFVDRVEVKELPEVGSWLAAKDRARRHQAVGVLVGEERQELAVATLHALEQVDLERRAILSRKRDAALNVARCPC